MPRVTVLMPIRDAAGWLDEAIDSIVAQTETDWELLAVDDGSRDGSAGVLARRASTERRIRTATTTPARRGLVAALNLGLSLSCAPLLARMDADDVAEPGRLQRQCAALDADASLFAVACRVRAFPEEALTDGMRRYIEWQNGLSTPEQIARDRFVESPVLHPSTVLRTRPLRDGLGGWRDAGWPEDWDLFLRALSEGWRIGRVDEALVSWRLHDRQATRLDARYGEDRLLACRAHHLARELRGRRLPAVWMLGAGPVGKALCKALAAESVLVDGLVDVDPRKVGGRVRSAEHSWPVIAMEELFAARPRPFAISAVGRPRGRDDVRALLEAHGWAETVDFVVAA